MKTKPHDPIGGCTHGSTTDTDNKGLTKKEWLVGKALTCGTLNDAPEKVADWAFKTAEAAIKLLNQPPAVIAADPVPPAA